MKQQKVKSVSGVDYDNFFRYGGMESELRGGWLLIHAYDNGKDTACFTFEKEVETCKHEPEHIERIHIIYGGVHGFCTCGKVVKVKASGWEEV